MEIEEVEPKDQGHGSTITLCHTHLKKAILHLKTSIVRIFFRLTVHSNEKVSERLPFYGAK